MARPQKKGLSLKTQKSGQLVIEIKGQVRFTGLNIQGSSFEKGAVGIYEDFGKFTIGVERPGKAFKIYKLSSNIYSIRAKRDQMTIALRDNIQVLVRECPLQDVIVFERYLNNIQLGVPLKGLMDPKDDMFDFVDERKENLSKGSLRIKGENETSVSSKFGRTFASQETPSKSPIFNRRHGSHLKAKMWDSPASQEWPEIESSFKITESKRFKPVFENERTDFVTSPSLSSAWARPPGEERSHSPRLMYDRRSVSPTCVSAPRNKSPKSKRRLIENDAVDLADESDEENMIPLSSRSTSTVSKRPTDSKRMINQSPLRLKAMHGSNYESTPKPTLVKSPASDWSQKPGTFYSSSSSITHRASTGLRPYASKRSFGLSKPTSRRQLNVFAFKRRDQEKIYSKSPSSQLALTGFANLGNTCYMNAILQCLLGIPTFSHDLNNSLLIDKVSRMSLYKYLHNLLTAKKFNENQEKQRLILRNIKRAISNQAARFSGYMQHDAHEFLGQCLDQLKEDNLKLLPSTSETEEADESEIQERKKIEAACPVSKNFECQVSHCIKCAECGSQITREEVFHDFSLDIPEIDENTDPEDKDLQDLLHDYFEEESIGYKCEKCDCENATLAHHISKLPRVVILHLKRYELDSDYTKYKKKLDTVDVPIELDLGVLCTDETTNAPQFEKTPKSGMKRPISNESPEDLDDFQISYKARRKLSLPEVPKLSDPEKDNDTSLTFEHDMEEAKKLSLGTSVNLDTATEEEQMEWALKESMKAERSDEENVIIPDDELPVELLAMDPLCDAEKMQGGETYTGVVSQSRIDGSKRNEQTFTGVREKENKIDLKKCEELEKSGISEWLSVDERKNEKEDDALLIEGLNALENEDDELKRVLEISLKEYNEKSTPIPRYSNQNNMKGNSNSKRRKATQNSNVTPRKYRLVGIVSHIGDSSAAGHYISDVFDCKEKEWKSYNDTSVKKVNEYEVRYGRKHCAYIFFYIDETCFQAITSK